MADVPLAVDRTAEFKKACEVFLTYGMVLVKMPRRAGSGLLAAFVKARNPTTKLLDGNAHAATDPYTWQLTAGE